MRTTRTTTDRHEDERITFLTTARLPSGVMAGLADAALRTLQPAVTHAWIDNVTCGEWQPEQLSDVEALTQLELTHLAAGTRRKGSGMGIDVDLGRVTELALMIRLAPFTIHAEGWGHAEGWAHEASAFTFDDCGDNACFDLTAAQAVQLAARLRACGLVFPAVLEPLTSGR